MTFFLLLILGLFVGLLSSFFGVGGGVLIVPGLYLFYPDMDHQSVIGTSLFVILCNSLINVINLKKQLGGVKINKRIIMPLGIAMVLGALSGSYLTGIFPKSTVKLIFGIVLILISAKHLFSKNSEDQNNSPNGQGRLLGLGLFGYLGGLISGLTGIGGGAVIVPTLIYFVKIPLKIVSLYSNTLMIFATSTGVIFYLFQTTKIAPVSSLQFFQFGALNIAIAFFLIAGAFVTSPYGGKLTTQVSAKTSKYLFAFLLFFMGLRLTINSIDFF